MARIFEWICERCEKENRSGRNICKYCSFVRVRPAMAYDAPDRPRPGSTYKGKPLGVIPITCQKCGKEPPGNSDLGNAWILRSLTLRVIFALEEDYQYWPELKEVVEKELMPYAGKQVCPLCFPREAGHQVLIQNLERKPNELEVKEERHLRRLTYDLRQVITHVRNKYPELSDAAVMRMAKSRARTPDEERDLSETIRDEYPHLSDDEVIGLVRGWRKFTRDEMLAYKMDDLRVQRLLRSARPVKFSLMKKHEVGDDILSALEELEEKLLWIKGGYKTARDRAEEAESDNEPVVKEAAETRDKLWTEWKRREAVLMATPSDDPDETRRLKEWVYRAQSEYSNAERNYHDLTRFAPKNVSHYRSRMRRLFRLYRRYARLVRELRGIYTIRWEVILDNLPVEWKIAGLGSKIPTPFGAKNFRWSPYAEQKFRSAVDAVLALQRVKIEGCSWIVTRGPMPHWIYEIGYVKDGKLVAGADVTMGRMVLPWEKTAAFRPFSHRIADFESDEEAKFLGPVPLKKPEWQPTSSDELRQPGEDLASYLERKKPTNEPKLTTCAICRIPTFKVQPLPIGRVVYDEVKKKEEVIPVDTQFVCPKCFEEKKGEKEEVKEPPKFVPPPPPKEEKPAAQVPADTPEVTFRNDTNNVFREIERILRKNHRIIHFTPIIRYDRKTFENELWALVIPYPGEVLPKGFAYKDKYVIRLFETDSLRWKTSFLWLWLWKDRPEWQLEAKRKKVKLGPEGLSRPEEAFHTFHPEEICEILGLSLPRLPREYWRGVYHLRGIDEVPWTMLEEHLLPEDKHYRFAVLHKKLREEYDELYKETMKRADKLKTTLRDLIQKEEVEERRHQPFTGRTEYRPLTFRDMTEARKGEEEWKERKLHERNCDAGISAAINFKSYIVWDTKLGRIDEAMYEEWLRTWIEPGRKEFILSHRADIAVTAVRGLMEFLKSKGREIPEEVYKKWTDAWWAEEEVARKKKGPAHPK